jgi:hypothetical protein
MSKQRTPEAESDDEAADLPAEPAAEATGEQDPEEKKAGGEGDPARPGTLQSGVHP